MSLCDPSPFFHIPTELLVYLARFLSFRDKTALALTCVGFWRTLTDPEAAFLMLGGLRTRLVDAMVQFEDWETLAKIMRPDYKHVQAAVTRSFWKGSVALGSRFPDMVTDTELALALLGGHGHVLEKFPAGRSVALEIIKLIRMGSIGLRDAALGVILDNIEHIFYNNMLLVLDLAASTRNQDRMVDVLERAKSFNDHNVLKTWCYHRGWMTLGNRLFPDAHVDLHISVARVSMTRFFFCDEARLMLNAMGTRGICKTLQDRTIFDTPKRFLDYYAPLMVKNNIKNPRNGLLVIRDVRNIRTPDLSPLLRQQLIDTAQGSDCFLLSQFCKCLVPFFPPTVDPIHVSTNSYFDRNEILVLPAFDHYYFERNVCVLQNKNLYYYSGMVMEGSRIIHDREVFDVMLDALSEELMKFVTCDADYAVLMAAFAQGRVQECIDTGLTTLARQVAEWSDEVDEPGAVVIWECIQKHGFWNARPEHIARVLPLHHFQDALDQWVADPNSDETFEFLCKLDGSEDRIKDLDFYGLRDMFLEPGAMAMKALNSSIFYNAEVRRKFLTIVWVDRLRDKILELDAPYPHLPKGSKIDNLKDHIITILYARDHAHLLDPLTPGPGSSS